MMTRRDIFKAIGAVAVTPRLATPQAIRSADVNGDVCIITNLQDYPLFEFYVPNPFSLRERVTVTDEHGVVLDGEVWGIARGEYGSSLAVPPYAWVDYDSYAGLWRIYGKAVTYRAGAVRQTEWESHEPSIGSLEF